MSDDKNLWERAIYFIENQFKGARCPEPGFVVYLLKEGRAYKNMWKAFYDNHKVDAGFKIDMDSYEKKYLEELNE